PAVGLILTQEENNQIISDLFDYYYENRSWAVVDYNIRNLKKDQNKQILKLLDENFDFCTQSISELGQTDIIHHYIPMQDIWLV
ncbi:28058_t:CDS:1, partial [Racocetra persica]